jgi:hypothetical protein
LKEKTKDQRVTAEVRRLKKIYAGLTPDEAKVCEGLIIQAARLRIMLDDMWQDICEHGDVEEFSQSPDLDPYERQRPVAQLFNTRDKNYQTIIKQLCDRLPEDSEKADAGAEARKWVR